MSLVARRRGLDEASSEEEEEEEENSPPHAALLPPAYKAQRLGGKDVKLALRIMFNSRFLPVEPLRTGGGALAAARAAARRSPIAGSAETGHRMLVPVTEHLAALLLGEVTIGMADNTRGGDARSDCLRGPFDASSERSALTLRAQKAKATVVPRAAVAFERVAPPASPNDPMGDTSREIDKDSEKQSDTTSGTADETPPVGMQGADGSAAAVGQPLRSSLHMGDEWTITCWFQLPLPTLGRAGQNKMHTIAMGLPAGSASGGPGEADGPGDLGAGSSQNDGPVEVGHAKPVCHALMKEVVGESLHLGIETASSRSPLLLHDFNLHSLPHGWHFLGVVAGGGCTNFYVDGRYRGAVADQVAADLVWMGNCFAADGRPDSAFGSLADVRVYLNALDAQQVRELDIAGNDAWGGLARDDVGIWGREGQAPLPAVLYEHRPWRQGPKSGFARAPRAKKHPPVEQGLDVEAQLAEDNGEAGGGEHDGPPVGGDDDGAADEMDDDFGCDPIPDAEGDAEGDGAMTGAPSPPRGRGRGETSSKGRGRGRPKKAAAPTSSSSSIVTVNTQSKALVVPPKGKRRKVEQQYPLRQPEYVNKTDPEDPEVEEMYERRDMHVRREMMREIGYHEEEPPEIDPMIPRCLNARETWVRPRDRGSMSKDIYLICGICTEPALLRDPRCQKAPFWATGKEAPCGFNSRPDFERHLRAQHCWPLGGQPPAPSLLLLPLDPVPEAGPAAANGPPGAGASDTAPSNGQHVDERQSESGHGGGSDLAFLTEAAPRMSMRQQIKALQEVAKKNGEYVDEEPVVRWGDPGSGDGHLEVEPLWVKQHGSSKFEVQWGCRDSESNPWAAIPGAADLVGRAEIKIIRRSMAFYHDGDDKLPGLDDEDEAEAEGVAAPQQPMSTEEASGEAAPNASASEPAGFQN